MGHAIIVELDWQINESVPTGLEGLCVNIDTMELID